MEEKSNGNTINSPPMSPQFTTFQESIDFAAESMSVRSPMMMTTTEEPFSIDFAQSENSALTMPPPSSHQPPVLADENVVESRDHEITVDKQPLLICVDEQTEKAKRNKKHYHSDKCIIDDEDDELIGDLIEKPSMPAALRLFKNKQKNAVVVADSTKSKANATNVAQTMQLSQQAVTNNNLEFTDNYTQQFQTPTRRMKRLRKRKFSASPDSDHQSSDKEEKSSKNEEIVKRKRCKVVNEDQRDSDSEHEIDFTNTQDYREMIQEDPMYDEDEEDEDSDAFVKAGYALRATHTRRQSIRRQSKVEEDSTSTNNAIDALVVIDDDTDDDDTNNSNEENEDEVSSDKQDTPEDVTLRTPEKSTSNSREERKRRLDDLVRSHGKKKPPRRRLVRNSISSARVIESSDEDSGSDEREKAISSDDEASKEFSFPLDEISGESSRRTSHRLEQASASLDDFIVPDEQELTQYSSSDYELLEDEEEEDEDEKAATQYNIDFDAESQTQQTTHASQSHPSISYYGPRKIEESFKIVLQYYLSCILDADFESCIAAEEGESYFVPALRKVFSELETKKSSVVSSSVWNSQFTKDLHSQPKIAQKHSRRSNQHNCEVCRRTGHPAVCSITFQGERLDEKFYSSPAVANITTNSMSKNTKAAIYRVGSHCFRRVILYHVMHHYKYLILERLKLLASAAEKEVRRVKNLTDNAKVSETDIVEEVMNSQDVSDLFRGYQNLLNMVYTSASRAHSNDPLTSYNELLSHCFPDAVEADILLPQSSLAFSGEQEALSATPKRGRHQRAKMNELHLVRKVDDLPEEQDGTSETKSDIASSTPADPILFVPSSPPYTPPVSSDDEDVVRLDSPVYAPTTTDDEDILTTKLY